MANGFPDPNPRQALWPYLHYLFDHQDEILGGFSGKSWYVDATSGNTSDTDGNSWASAFGTMAQAFAKISSGDRIFFRGKVREQLTTPVNVFDVSVIGVGNRPRHADATPVGGNVAAATWTTPASGAVATTPLVKVLQQGWRFVNILFAGPTTAACIRLFRDGGAGDLERDASHAEIIGCRFASGYDGIRDQDGCYGVLVQGNRFVSQTDYAIYGSGNIGLGQGAWHIRDNQFDSNTNHVLIAGGACRIQDNIFDDGGTPGATVVLNTNNGGGAGGNNFVIHNYFQTTTANFNTPDVVGCTTDVWTENAAFDTAAPGTSGIYEVGQPA